jgi:phosphate transporter
MHNVVDQAYPFRQASRAALQEAISKLVTLYAKCVTRGDESGALKQLRVHQREHIAWERDTVWRQMISNERRGEGDGRVRSLGDDVEVDPLTPGAKSHNFVFHTRFGTLRFKKKKAFLPIAIIVFIGILKLRVVSGVEANNCFAILTFATLLWATEVYIFVARNRVSED